MQSFVPHKSLIELRGWEEGKIAAGDNSTNKIPQVLTKDNLILAMDGSEDKILTKLAFNRKIFSPSSFLTRRL